ncbi:alpha/beta fold hydrolase [Actinomadura sp. 6N118]|uniref:alpha/beta fold hydrolase n=1 Tax=Actinomadura sp. 6N118 TaxID=3375151 RepID=UPI0037940036
MGSVVGRLTLATAAAVAGAAALSASYQALGERADRRRFPAPGRLVNVGGHRLHLWAEGEGGPTVVCIPALGTSGLEWVAIQRALSPHVRACVYDRGGLGWSDLPRGPRSVCRLADELAELLAAADLPGPFVLVGHSVGGIIARDMVTRYRDRVCGLVLVDSSHEQMWDRLPGYQDRWQFARRAARRRLEWLGARRALANLGLRPKPRPDRGYPAELADAGLAMDRTSRQRRARIREMLALHRGFAEAYARRAHLGSLPMTVLTAGPDDPHIAANYAELKRRTHGTWLELQTELAALADGSTHRVIDTSGHHIHLDSPSALVQEVLAVCERARVAHRPR